MAAKRKTKTKKTSLTEFRAWLEGVEEMQGNDWVPTIEQWKRIREKIDSIEDAPAPAPAPAVVNNHVPIVPIVPTPGASGSSFDSIARQPAPAAPMKMSPNAPVAMGQAQVKTPDIDTSANDYTSAYE